MCIRDTTFQYCPCSHFIFDINFISYFFNLKTSFESKLKNVKKDMEVIYKFLISY